MLKCAIQNKSVHRRAVCRFVRVILRTSVILFLFCIFRECANIFLARGFSDNVIFIKINDRVQDTARQLCYRYSGKDQRIYNQQRIETGLKWLIRAGYTLKVGEYAIDSSMSLYDVMQKIHSGQCVQHKITFAEGMTHAQIVEKLHNDHRLMPSEISLPAEGYLMPDTYVFSYPMTWKDIINMMHDKMQCFLHQIDTKNIPFGNSIDAMIRVASLVEKEAACDEERLKIAAVYWNRLHKKMRLQADPSLIYDITKGKHYRIKIRKKTLRENMSLYNTYRHHGLPPSAICNPGRASIIAASTPVMYDYLFFRLARNKKHHLFAETFKEHCNNQYL